MQKEGKHRKNLLNWMTIHSLSWTDSIKPSLSFAFHCFWKILHFPSFWCCQCFPDLAGTLDAWEIFPHHALAYLINQRFQLSLSNFIVIAPQPNIISTFITVSLLICSFTTIKRATLFQSSSTGSIFNTNKLNPMNQKTLKTLRSYIVLSYVVIFVISLRQKQDKFTRKQMMIIDKT
jgi:hypothetical protein